MMLKFMSRLETTLEWAQNTCEPPRIILHPNYHLSRWLPLSSHSRLLTPGLAVPYSSLCGFLHGYLSSCRRLLQALRPIRFPTMLFVIMHCCLFQLIFSSYSCLVLCVYICCLLTNNADAYSGLRINQCYCLRAPTAPLHVLGLNAYIVRPFGHPS